MYDESLLIRFWAKVDKSGGPDACWLWMGASYYGKSKSSLTSKGKPRRKSEVRYGSFRISSKPKKTRSAHQISYEIHNGPIPEGMVIRHMCHTGICVNPAHLRVGTVAQNNQDMRDAGREAWGRGEEIWTSKLTEESVFAARERYAIGNISEKQLAKELGISTTQVSYILTGHSWAWVGGPVQEVRQKQKASDDDVREIRRLYDSGCRISEISGLFPGITVSQVSNLAKRRSRKDLE